MATKLTPAEKRKKEAEKVRNAIKKLDERIAKIKATAKVSCDNAKLKASVKVEELKEKKSSIRPPKKSKPQVYVPPFKNVKYLQF